MTTTILTPAQELIERLKAACKDAILAQSACNLSGIIHSLHRHMDTLWELARLAQKGTDWVNQHPVSVLFAEQVAHLTRIYSSSASLSRWHQAMDYCEKVKAGQVEVDYPAYTEPTP